MERKNKLLKSALKYFYNLYTKLYVKTAEEDKETEDNETKKSFLQLDSQVSEIMTARVDILALEISTSFNEVMQIIAKSGFSRIPVYEKELDQIKGVLHVKDLFKYLCHDKEFQWSKIIREAFFVPEGKNTSDLLKEFQEAKRHQAIVVDEFGCVVGIVSLEDILEEIVGEISDEFDSLQPSFVTKLGEKTYIFAGKISINDFCKAISLTDDKVFDPIKGDADTLAGMLISLAGHLPKKGETIKYQNYFFIIEKADNRKIEKVKLILK
ncbi:MAG: hemolysin family protein [Bacteroidales bacterium]|nr:hemolysin family protein [Bacteroidales bacterium]